MERYINRDSDGMDDNLIVLQGEATCSAESVFEGYLTDRRYPVLAIIRAKDYDEAVAIFEAKCNEAGWILPNALRVGEFSISGDDPYLVNTERMARETGYGWILYSKPVD